MIVFQFLARYSRMYPVWVVLIYAVVAVGAFGMVRVLVIDTDIANLLPSDNPHVLAMERLSATMGNEASVEVIVKAANREDAIAVADAFAERVLRLRWQDEPMIARTELRYDAAMLRDHVLLFMTEAELVEINGVLREELDQVRRQINPFFVDFEDEAWFDEADGAAEANPSESGGSTGGGSVSTDGGSVSTGGGGASTDGGVNRTDGGSVSTGGGGASTGGGVNRTDETRLTRLDDLQNRVPLPPEYITNADSTAVLLTLYPGGSKSSIAFIDFLFSSLDQAIEQELESHSPPDIQTNDSGVTIVYSGALREYIRKFNDIRATLDFAVVFGVGAIFLFLVVYILRLRKRNFGSARPMVSSLSWSLVMVAAIIVPLLVSLLVTYALGQWFFGNLNIMTTVLVAILLGVNMDYILHFLSNFSENRGKMSLEESVSVTVGDCGKALLISSLTSALAMLVLLLSEFRGFFEFGALFFVGITTTFVITMTLFVALLTLIDRFGVNERAYRLSPDNPFLSTSEGNRKPVLSQSEDLGPATTYDSAVTSALSTESSLYRQIPLIGTVTLTLLLLVALVGLPRVAFEYDFGKLEPRVEESSDFDQLKRTFDITRRSDPAFYLLPDRKTTLSATEIIRRGMSADPTAPPATTASPTPTSATKTPAPTPTSATTSSPTPTSATASSGPTYRTVGHLESIHSRYPATSEEIHRRHAQISELQLLLDDPLLTSLDHPLLPLARNSAEITLQLNQAPDLRELPDFFINRFLDRDGALAHLIIINPNMSLSDGKRSMLFKNDAGTVTVDGVTYFAASTSIIAASILELIQSEMVFLVSIPLLTTLVCLIVFFRSVRWGTLSFLPLAFTMIVLAGGMALAGLKFNLFNVIVLPAVLGVGADNGVHLFHRIRSEPGLRVRGLFRTTGQYITASSITTVLGFLGLTMTGHPGLQSMGIVAVSGIVISLGMALLVAAIFVERRPTSE